MLPFSRELQKLTTEERCAKEQLEATISELKARASAADASEKRLGDARNEMAAMKAKLRQTEETSPLLLRLQAEMAQLKQQHTVAIQEVLCCCFPHGDVIYSVIL